MPRRRRWRALFLLPSLVALAGCFTGDRPRFEDDDAPTNTAATGDPNIDAVLQRLDKVATATFTAHLDVLTRLGPIETAVSVAQAGSDRRSVTIGDVRYLREGASELTCDLTTGECREGIDESRVSNVQLHSERFGSGAAARLRQDARVKIAGSTASTAVFADQTATCVDVPVSGGVTRYCVLDDGVLAAMSDGALAVTLVGYSPIADEGLFTQASPP